MKASLSDHCSDVQPGKRPIQALLMDSDSMDNDSVQREDMMTPRLLGLARELGTSVVG